MTGIVIDFSPPYAKIENRQTHNVKVDALGGPAQIASLLKTSATSGINSDDTADIEQRQQGRGYYFASAE